LADERLDLYLAQRRDKDSVAAEHFGSQ